ncbi:MAG: hypothetical protein ACLPH3_03315 [Terracidiphilus sp.]
MATVLQSTIAGVKRQLPESDVPEAQFEVMQRQLVLVVRSYVRACMAQVGEEKLVSGIVLAVRQRNDHH